MDRKIEVVLIELPVKQRLRLKRPELLTYGFYLPLKFFSKILILFGGIQLYKLAQIIYLRYELLPWIIAVLKRVQPLVCLLRLILVIPEIGGKGLLLFSLYLILNPGLFKDASILGRLLPLRYRIQLCSLKTYITPCFYSPHFSI